MCKKIKENKKLKKALKITLISILSLIILAIASTVFYIYYNIDNIKNNLYTSSLAPDSFKSVDISMSKEEMLEDFSKAYEYAVLSNPNASEFEKLYGLNYEDLYKEYESAISDCKDEFEYIYLLSSFVKNFPSGHTAIPEQSPEYLRTIYFELSGECGLSKNEDDYLNAWSNYLANECLRYDIENTNTETFQHLNGEYIHDLSGTSEYAWATLLEINGKAPSEYVLDSMQFYLLKYDACNETLYREGFVFNDRYGKDVTLKIQLDDGTVVEKDSFLDYEFNFACNLYDLYYEKEAIESDASAAAVTEYKPYYLHVDEENDLVYLNSKKCTDTGMDSFNEEFKAALEGHDNVIIDLRENTGGNGNFCSKYIYPNLFTDDMVVNDKITLSKNDMTEIWVKRLSNKQYYNIEDNHDGTYTYINPFEYEGLAEKDYNIYVLTGNKTFSSADLIASTLGSKDNVTLVGNNTKGEGREGMIFTSLLPESHLIMYFVPGKNNTITPADGVYGTLPDIYSELTKEAIKTKYEMRQSGIDCEEYENKIIWDNTLNETIELIKNSK